MRTYTSYRSQWGTLTNNTSAANLTFGMTLIMDSLRYLTTRFFFNETTYTVPGGTISGTQNYPLPFNIKTIINATITIGTTKYRLTEVPTRDFWDALNFVPYTSDVPQYYFIYQGEINVFPIPASSSNTFTINYKQRITDLSQDDYTTGTVAVTNGSTTVTGTTTVWTSQMAGRWIQFASGSGGDNNWYKIASVASATSLTLVNQYQGETDTSVNYIIGEVPLLPEDYQDLPHYRAASIYFTTRVPDPTRAQSFATLYKEGYDALEAEFGAKSNSVAITPNDNEVINPNLYVRSIG